MLSLVTQREGGSLDNRLNEIGRRAFRRRRELRLTQKQIAERAVVSGGYVSRLEHGQAGVRLGDLLKIADALSMRLVELVGEDSREFAERVRGTVPAADDILPLFAQIATNLPELDREQRSFVVTALRILAEYFAPKH